MRYTHFAQVRIIPRRFEMSFKMIINLFVTSKNETKNSPIHEFKLLQNVF